MENDLEKDKERANNIVNEIFEKYESNSYMYQKINTNMIFAINFVLIFINKTL